MELKLKAGQFYGKTSQSLAANGFADQTHFTRSFKRITGMTPTEFRRLSVGR